MRDHECSICSRAFGSSGALARHLSSRAHRPYRCNRCCDRTFQTAAALEQHTRDRRARIEESLRAGTPAMSRRHLCSDCGRSYGTAAALQQHRNDAPGHGREDGGGNCPDCHRYFRTARGLAQHVTDSGPHRYVPSVLPDWGWEICTACLADGFGSPDEWARHVLDTPDHEPLHHIAQRRIRPDVSRLGPGLGYVNLEDREAFNEALEYFRAIGDNNGYMELVWERRFHLEEMGLPSDDDAPSSFIDEDEEDEEVAADSYMTMMEVDLPAPAGDAPSNATAPSTPGSADVHDNNIDIDSATPADADANDSPFGPPTLEEHLEAVSAKITALEAELRSTKAILKEKNCGMCYENPRDTVAKCGHRFCGSCVASWQRQHAHAFHAPCPMCRKSMGKPIRLFAD